MEGGAADIPVGYVVGTRASQWLSSFATAVALILGQQLGALPLMDIVQTLPLGHLS